jgi:uncharacterized SAM-binding protein YcdF (DUF218 family)
MHASPQTPRIGTAIVVAFASGPIAAARLSVADHVVAQLQTRFHAPDLGDGSAFVGVIALGGNPDRVREAGRLSSMHAHLRVLISGAGGQSQVFDLLEPNVATARVMVESTSRTTFENAKFSSRLIGGLPPGRWLLVTSASPMPRAIAAFRRQGVDVAAWPIFDLAPGADNLEEIVRHETVGLLAYWVLGRSSALWPQ